MHRPAAIEGQRDPTLSVTESGLYNNASEVIREALRFMDAHEEWGLEIKKALLRKQLKTGTDQIDDGGGVSIESKKALDSLFDDLS